MIRLRKLIEMMTSFEGTTFVYALSYSILLSLAPLSALLILFFRNTPDFLEQLTSFALLYIPAEMVSPFVEFFRRNSPTEWLPLLFFVAVSLWVASKAIYSFLLISAHLDQAELPRWFLRLVSLVMFVILLAVLSGAVIVLQRFRIRGLCAQVLILFFGFCLFYRLLSFRNYQWRIVFRGAALTTAALSLLGFFFFVCIRRFTRYESVYGPLSSLVILFLSVYIIAAVIYFGFCVNQVAKDKDLVQPLKHYTVLVNRLRRIFPFSRMK